MMARIPGSRAQVEELVRSITRGNPGSVKTVLASVVFALMVYQLVLAAIGYRKLPVMEARPAFLTHRASGDAIVVLVAIVALFCLGAYGFDDDSSLHFLAGIGLAVAIAAKVSVVRFFPAAGRFLPLLGVSVFVLLALTWFSAVPGFLSGDD
jgi:hypothetical protein